MFEQKIKDKSALVAIVGLGYVGLPLAVAFAEAGLRVLGFDVQQDAAGFRVSPSSPNLPPRLGATG